MKSDSGTKYCARCWELYGRLTPIAYDDETDWFSFIRLKYCDRCRQDAKREQTRDCMRRKREKQRLARHPPGELTAETVQLMREEIGLLRDTLEKDRQENAALRNRLAVLGVKFPDRGL